MPTTRVYIDGFNLYHGIIAPHRLHWLDLSTFALRLNRGQPVDRIIYCTAMVSGMPCDPDKPLRQEVYLRALGLACPNVEIVKGQFTSHDQLRPLAGCASSPTCAIKVTVRSEKGSDVNLASRLLHDAHMGRFDVAIVVSGDSDLSEPIRLVVSEIKKAVWVRNPRNKKSQELRAVASNYDRIRPAVLQASQLPQVVTNGTKTYSKPAKWSAPATRGTKHTVFQAACSAHGCNNQITTCRYL